MTSLGLVVAIRLEVRVVSRGIDRTAARHEAVLVLDLLRRERALLAAEQRSEGQQHQRQAKVRESHGRFSTAGRRKAPVKYMRGL
jgi:hypothetical protein